MKNLKIFIISNLVLIAISILIGFLITREDLYFIPSVIYGGLIGIFIPIFEPPEKYFILLNIISLTTNMSILYLICNYTKNKKKLHITLFFFMLVTIIFGLINIFKLAIYMA